MISLNYDSRACFTLDLRLSALIGGNNERETIKITYMSHYSKIFNKVPVEIPNRSGFDLSHENLFTAPVGTLIPAMVSEVLPNDTVSLGVSSQIQLPPMATDFYGRVRGCFEAFFVPFRILYGGWKDIITRQPTDNYLVSAENPQAHFLPYIQIPAASAGAGSLADYLGYKPYNTSATVTINNPLPFLAYHKIWEDWYRDSRIQYHAFVKSYGTASTDISLSPSIALADSSGAAPTFSSYALNDSVMVYALRQRNFQRDYFTNATPQPQLSNESRLAFSVDSQGDGSFSIASLRAANSLQLWLERNNIAGYRYGDQIKANFGIYPSDASLDRPIYLGSQSVNIYNKSVFTNAIGGSSSSYVGVTFNNPFYRPGTTSSTIADVTPGAKFGSPLGVGDGSLIDKFTANEHGFIFVMFSIVPDALYSTGIRRYLKRSVSTDFAFPILASVGDQSISNDELLPTASSGTFGYTQRYSEYKYHDDEVHGLLRDGQSLASFALQRTFSTTPVLGSTFLQIPTNYLDGVSATASNKTSKFGAWCDVFFSYKKTSTLPAYSIPTLGDIKNTHTEVVDLGGKSL